MIKPWNVEFVSDLVVWCDQLHHKLYEEQGNGGSLSSLRRKDVKLICLQVKKKAQLKEIKKYDALSKTCNVNRSKLGRTFHNGTVSQIKNTWYNGHGLEDPI